MFQSFGKALSQSFDPAFRQVFGLSLAASVVTFILAWLFLWLLLSWAGGLLAEWLDTVELWGWVEQSMLVLFDAGAIVGILITSFFLFPSVMAGTMSLLLEKVAKAVERRYYPNLPAAREQPIAEGVLSALSLAGAILLLNILALPLYFIPVINVLVFYALNGYLLGREYFELVAQRRLPAGEVKSFRRERRGRVFLSGVVIAVLLTIPLLNLVTPIIATAFMLHVFEGMRQKQPR